VKLLVLSHDDVTALLPMDACISLMRETLMSLARGEAFQPPRAAIRPPGAAGVLGLMPAYRAAPAPFFGLKEVAVFPGNHAVGLDAHQGLVILHDGTNGQPLAAMNASAITAIRTAAVSAVATDALARREASSLALIGAGVQAHAHLDALPRVRQLRDLRIASRTPAHAGSLAAEARSRGLPARATSIADAVKGADVVTTVTSSREPVFDGAWLAEGAHVNAVGASARMGREIDDTTVARSLFFVDSREASERESSDYVEARERGTIGSDHIRAELGDVLLGRHPGRTSERDVTLFRSQGLAIEDLACAVHCYAAARRDGRGVWALL
jgi:ornithine cyclodeaminase/alanine dehydrogenase-like protein (mu-crystallin family)